MQSLDELFRRFIEEKKSQGVLNKQLRRYEIVYQCFRRMLPNNSIDSLNTVALLNFYEKLRIRLRKAEHWHSNNNFSLDSAILACMSKLGSFFLWLKYNEYISVNPIDELSLSIKQANSHIVKPSTGIPKVDKLKLYSVLRNKNLIVKTKKNNIDNSEYFDKGIYLKQLKRIYDSFFLLDDPVFYQGIADYIKYISEHPYTSSVITKHILLQADEVFYKACLKAKRVGAGSPDDILHCVKNEYYSLTKQMQNSYWGAWFNLELIYLIIYNKIKDVLKRIKDNIDLIMDFCTLACEMETILANDSAYTGLNFNRNEYSSWVNRIHNYILEILEKELQENNEPDSKQEIIYKYNQYGIPSGELLIKAFKPIQFVKTPAKAMFFLYSHKDLKKHYSYIDFNEYQGPENKQLTSNEFRLMIEAINKRVKSSTAGFLKELLVKQTGKSDFKSANKYRWGKGF